jgi:hypothetical protein
MSDSPITPLPDTLLFDAVGDAEAYIHTLRRKDPPTQQRRYKPCPAGERWFAAVSDGDGQFRPAN